MDAINNYTINVPKELCDLVEEKVKLDRIESAMKIGIMSWLIASVFSYCVFGEKV